MRKLNLALMILLTFGVIASAGYLALSGNVKNHEGWRLDDQRGKLFRKLADDDPDRRREAEGQLRSMGPRAVPILREAARSDDPRLADRAAELLREFEPPVRLVLERPEAGVHRFRVRLVNEGREAVLLARDPVGRYGRIEAVDGAGRTVPLGLETEAAGSPEQEADVVSVPAGQTFDLFAGRGDGTIAPGQPFPGPGAWKVRFIYDASEGSDYRRRIEGSPDGIPLPSEVLVSNDVAVHVGK